MELPGLKPALHMECQYHKQRISMLYHCTDSMYLCFLTDQGKKLLMRWLLSFEIFRNSVHGSVSLKMSE